MVFLFTATTDWSDPTWGKSFIVKVLIVFMANFCFHSYRTLGISQRNGCSVSVLFYVDVYCMCLMTPSGEGEWCLHATSATLKRHRYKQLGTTSPQQHSSIAAYSGEVLAVQQFFKKPGRHPLILCKTKASYFQRPFSIQRFPRNQFAPQLWKFPMNVRKRRRRGGRSKMNKHPCLVVDSYPSVWLTAGIKQITQKLVLLLCWWCRAILTTNQTNWKPYFL